MGTPGDEPIYIADGPLSIAEEAAQALHDRRRTTDPNHDQVACWYRCATCDWHVPSVRAGKVLTNDEVQDRNA